MNHYSFKNLLICYILGFFPIALLAGILSLIGLTPMYFNSKEYYGFEGLLISIGITLFLGILIAGASFVILNFGRFIYNQLISKK